MLNALGEGSMGGPGPDVVERAFAQRRALR